MHYASPNTDLMNDLIDFKLISLIYKWFYWLTNDFIDLQMILLRLWKGKE